MKVEFSIIVPIYNVEKYLNRCLESLINQTFTNIEIILVNDGSKDNSLNICKKYSSTDKRIKIVDKANGGLSDARNKGLEHAMGNYIWFVDSDDYVAKEACEEFYKFIKIHNPDIISFGYNEIISGRVNNEKKYTNEIKVLDFKAAYKKYLHADGIVHSTWSKIFRKKIVENISFPRGKKAEDLATTYKFLYNSKKIIILDKAFYNYDRRDDSIMGQNSIDLTIDIYKFSKEKFKFEFQTLPSLKKQAQSIYFNNIIKLYYRLNQEKKYENLVKECEEEILKIDYKYLVPKSKVIYFLYKVNPKIVKFILCKIWRE